MHKCDAYENFSCKICHKVGCLGPSKTQGVKIAPEWTSCSVTFHGEGRQNDPSSLQKNLCS